MKYWPGAGFVERTLFGRLLPVAMGKHRPLTPSSVAERRVGKPGYRPKAAGRDRQKSIREFRSLEGWNRLIAPLSNLCSQIV